MLQNQAHGTFTDFRGVGSSLSHGLIFSRVEASTKPGAVQIVALVIVVLLVMGWFYKLNLYQNHYGLPLTPDGASA